MADVPDMGPDFIDPDRMDRLWRYAQYGWTTEEAASFFNLAPHEVEFFDGLVGAAEVILQRGVGVMIDDVEG